MLRGYSDLPERGAFFYDCLRIRGVDGAMHAERLTRGDESLQPREAVLRGTACVMFSKDLLRFEVHHERSDT